MRNFSAFLLMLTILVLLIFGASRYHDLAQQAGFCGLQSVSAVSDAPKWIVKDGEMTIVDFQNTDVPHFKRSNDLMIIGSKGTMGFQKIAKYLLEHPEKSLNITGFYEKTEIGKEGFENIGLARANMVKQSLLSEAVPTERINISAALSEDLNFDKEDNSYSAIKFDFVKSETQNGSEANGEINSIQKTGISIKDGAFETSTEQNFVYALSSIKFQEPVNKELGYSLNELVKHLKENPKKSLKLSGWYASEETNKSLMPNLGIARANYLKTYLKNLGLKSAQIQTEGKLVKKPRADEDQLFKGGIDFLIEEMASEEAKLNDIKKSLRAAPQLIYFHSNKDEIKMSDDLRKYFVDLAFYLDRMPKTKVSITGHTDSNGKSHRNKRLGQRRADFVLDLLKDNGIKADQLRAFSAGEKKPLKSNSTESGRAENRRVEIEVQF